MAFGSSTAWKSLTISWSFGGSSLTGWRVAAGAADGCENTGFVGILWVVIGLKKKRFVGFEGKDENFSYTNELCGILVESKRKEGEIDILQRKQWWRGIGNFDFDPWIDILRLCCRREVLELRRRKRGNKLRD